MPDITPEAIGVALFVGLFFGSMFSGWRSVAMVVFCFSWQLFTPTMMWLKDMVAMGLCLGATEIIFRIMSKVGKES